ncbi:hypothetical protein [Runella zeae]|uniref:hypothetical protein n=1 Tax=Runella zeae TaxID=94255 RepID=UPI00040A07A4|nr:hypothetical protein [Runella zeae]
MNSSDLLSYLTSQDEYHSFLEKILSRAGNLYQGVAGISSPLIENYIEMEKSCWKEDYTVASFYYIKQLEEIVIYGLNQVTLPVINSQLKQQSNGQWQLTPLGNQIFNYLNNRNDKLKEKLCNGADITLSDIIWSDKLNLFKHYFNSDNTDFETDRVLYYKRNHHGHANPYIDASKESLFKQKFPTCFHFMIITQINLKKYSSALNMPQNR